LSTLARAAIATSVSPQRLLRAVLIAGLAVFAIALLAHGVCGVDLAGLLHWLPACAFRSVTGLPCPGCGMTRALLLMAQLRLPEAIAMHPAAPFAVAGAAWFALGGPAPTGRWRAATSGLALCALLGLWVAGFASA
jgi:hypothetical protein